LKKILWGERSIGLRFFTSMEGFGKSSYLIVCSDKNYDITSVAAGDTRRKTRRGLENVEIRQFDFKELARLGHNLNCDTLARQGRDPRLCNESDWKQFCDATEGLDGFEAWGAFTGGKLASFVAGFQMEDHFTLLQQSSATEYLELYPNNALIFEVTRLKLASPEVTAVSYGPQSLDAPESLDAFKFHMGYKKLPMKQRVMFNPLIKPFIGSATQKIVQFAAGIKLKSNELSKLEGLIGFYLESD
jgi:hypothetical protein